MKPQRRPLLLFAIMPLAGCLATEIPREPPPLPPDHYVLPPRVELRESYQLTVLGARRTRNGLYLDVLVEAREDADANGIAANLSRSFTVPTRDLVPSGLTLLSHGAEYALYHGSFFQTPVPRGYPRQWSFTSPVVESPGTRDLRATSRHIATLALRTQTPVQPGEYELQVSEKLGWAFQPGAIVVVSAPD